jgi:hypothetical protein
MQVSKIDPQRQICIYRGGGALAEHYNTLIVKRGL